MTESVGQKLRQAREGQSLTLEQVAQATKIRVYYLDALERGDWGVLPSHIQVRGFLRSYAEHLGLSTNELLALLGQSASEDVPNEARGEAITSPAGEEKPTFEQSQSIFGEIGVTLRSRREMLGLSPEDVEQHIRIPKHYIDLLETGSFNQFPSPTQARGMLGNYANFLSMDTDLVLLRYAEGLQARLAPQQPVEKRPSRPQIAIKLPAWLRNLISADVVFAGVVILSLILFFSWAWGRIQSTQASQLPAPTAPSLAQILLPSATTTPTATPTPIATTASEQGEGPAEDQEEGDNEDAPAVINPQSVQLYVVIRQRTWMRVSEDGEIKFEGRVIPGSAYSFSANQRVEVLTGNGAALQIFYNDQDLGPLGLFGEVVNVIYSAQGVLTPTATLTPTTDPNLALTPSPTATVTPTDVIPVGP